MVSPERFGRKVATEQEPATLLQVSASASAHAANVSEAQNAWERAVLAELEKRKRYPTRAQRAGQQDTVYIRIVVDRAGRILSNTIYRSQQVDILDAAALDLVKESNPLPAPPAAVEGHSVEFIVPVEYLIRNSR